MIKANSSEPNELLMLSSGPLLFSGIRSADRNVTGRQRRGLHESAPTPACTQQSGETAESYRESMQGSGRKRKNLRKEGNKKVEKEGGRELVKVEVDREKKRKRTGICFKGREEGKRRKEREETKR